MSGCTHPKTCPRPIRKKLAPKVLSQDSNTSLYVRRAIIIQRNKGVLQQIIGASEPVEPPAILNWLPAGISG